LVANTPTTGSPAVFCSQKKEPWSHDVFPSLTGMGQFYLLRC
jgi:hypothetical protein